MLLEPGSEVARPLDGRLERASMHAIRSSEGGPSSPGSCSGEVSSGRHGILPADTWGCSSVGLERPPDKREVGGSNPPIPTNFLRGDEYRGDIAQLGERRFCKAEVVGSNPSISTIVSPHH